jgi:HEAT repeat protein
VKPILVIVTTCLYIFTLSCFQSESEKYLSNLKSENVTVRNKAIHYFAKEKDERCVPILINLLKEEQIRQTKIAALEALGKIGNTKATDVLISYLEEDDDEVNKVAAEALGKISDPRSVAALIKVLHNKDVQIVAIWALGNIGDKSAVSALTRLLDDEDKHVRYLTVQSLKKIGNRM